MRHLEQFVQRLCAQEAALRHQLVDVAVADAAVRRLDGLLVTGAGAAGGHAVGQRQVRVEAAEHVRLAPTKTTNYRHKLQTVIHYR